MYHLIRYKIKNPA